MDPTHTPTRQSPRRGAFITVALITGALMLSAVPAAHATCSPDTVVVYGPTQFTGSGINIWHIVEDEFSTSTSWGRRYVVEVDNGSTQVASLIVSLDGQQWIGSSEFGSLISSITRIIDVADGNQTHALTVSVKGTSSSYVTLRICHVSEPRFTIFGPTTFTWSSVPGTQAFGFTPPAGAKPPYTLRVINGDGDGFHRVTDAFIKVNISKVITGLDFGTGIATISRQVTLLSGAQRDSVIMSNTAPAGSLMSLRFTATDSTAPTLTVTSPAEGLVTEDDEVNVAGRVLDETPVTVTINGGTPIHADSTFSQNFGMASDGNYTITVHAANSACFSTDSVRHVARDRLAPTLNVSSLPSSTVDSSLTVSISWWDTTETVVTCDGDTVGIARVDSATYVFPLDFGPNRVVVRAVDALNKTTTVIRYVLRTIADDDPTSPPTASTLSTTETTPFRDGVAFLFTGGGAVQTGATAESLKADRVTVVRGRVLARDWGPIPNVVVRVLGRLYYGETRTRADGQFDLAVNGGGPIVLRFSKLGYLEAQRQMELPVNTFVTLDDIAMIGRSARFTVVDLENAKVARSRFATDANGDREIRLYFPGEMRARITNAVTPADSEFRYVRVRATEYTQGTQGPSAMPAELPPTSAYTYCVELSLDEADSLANASGLIHSPRFTKPVSCYVRNFLQYPVGARVPLGYFDRASGQWIAENNAVVLKIVGASVDTALVDSNGDGSADGAALLDSLGLSGEERRVLLSQYGVNATLWRARIAHFSPGDANPNAGPPPDELPKGPAPLFQLLKLLFGPCLSEGSIVECENRVLGERLPVTGTPHTLNYRSFRAPGDSAVRTVRVPIIGSTVPGSLDRIYVVLEVAGKVYKQEFPRVEVEANQITSITWDGLDIYGRRVEGSIDAQVRVGYRYFPSMKFAAQGSPGFANSARSSAQGQATSGDRSVFRVNWIRRSIVIGVPGTGSDGLGGWTISPHHVFDPKGRGAVYYGSGEVDPGDRIPMSRWTYANWKADCGSIVDFDDDPIPASGIRATALTTAPDGSVYFADDCTGSIYRVGKDGIAHRVAGTGTPGDFDPGSEGGPAREATLRTFKEIAFGPDGTLYIAAEWNVGHRGLICKVSPDGTLGRVIGDGQFHLYGEGDDGPVSSATTVEIDALTVAPDGSLFFAESGTSPGPGPVYTRVRRVGTNGVITTYAGMWCRSSSDEVGPATTVCVGSISDLGVDAGGNLYILEGQNHRLRKVTPEGTISTSLSLQNELFKPNAMGFAPDGSIYLANGAGSASQTSGLETHGVYRLDLDGNASIIGGGVSTGSFFEGVPVTAVPLLDASEIAVLPDGSYYVVSGGIYFVTQRFATDLGEEWMVPSQGGSEVHFFTKTGRHLRTRDALTGTLRHWFDYDATYGDLVAVHDADRGTTTIVRHSTTRVPQKLQAPDGQETILSLTSGRLTRVEDPGGNMTSLAYSAGGLLDSLTDVNNHRTTFTWGDDGRLDRDTDAASGYQDLEDHSALSRIRTVWRETALGRRTKFEVTPRDDGTMLRTVTSPAGQVTSMDYKLDTRVETTLPDGTVVTDSISGDPRFSIVAPVPAGTRVRLPSGLTRTVQVTRPYSATTFDPPATVSAPWVEQVLVNDADTVRTEFDAASLRLKVQRSLARTTTVTVDTAGRPIAIHIPGLDTLRRGYDSRGRLTELRQGDRGWRMSYDDRGQLAVLRDTLGHMTTFHYNSADRLTSQVLPGAREITFGYDAAGSLKSLTPPGGQAHEFDYTAVDLTDQYRPPAAGMTSSQTEYDYNLDHQLTSVQRPDSTTITLSNGTSTGRIDQVSIARGNAAFGYDGAGRLSTLSSPDSVMLTYGYDGAIDTLETWSGAVGGSVSIALDRDFRVSSQRVNGVNTAVYGYDRDGLVTQAGALTITRRADNGLITGTALAASNLTTVEEYNAFGERARSVGLSGSDTLWRALYARDALGRLIQIREKSLGVEKVWAYTYSDTGFLTRVSLDGTVSERYGYDANGNRLRFDTPGDSASALYDTQDRIVRYRGRRYFFGAAGELRAMALGADTTRYVYDPLGNLITVKLPNGDVITYVIDGRNRRVARKLNGTLTRRWLYQDQLEPVAEFDGAGNLIARYVYGTRAHVPDIVVKGDTTYRILTDHLGSVRVVVNAATGMIAQKLDYDGYGRVTNDTSPGFQCFGYAGGLSDGATGLVRFGARDYDAAVGRWTVRDPLGFSAGRANLFTYAIGDPANRIDPSGLKEGGRLDCIQSILDWIGYIDPTGTADGLNAALYLLRGRWAYAGISAAAIIPGLDFLKAERGLARWGKVETLGDHFARHGADFGAKSADDYARLADDFLEQSQKAGLPTKIGPDGTIRVYDSASNTFGAFNPDGTTKTLFKPGSPGYFDRQPGVLTPPAGR